MSGPAGGGGEPGNLNEVLGNLNPWCDGDDLGLCLALLCDGAARPSPTDESEWFSRITGDAKNARSDRISVEEWF